jgi:hypothetical protein
MSDRQPSLSEARSWNELLEVIERISKNVKYCSNGIWILNKKGEYKQFYKHLFSDVSERCHDCKGVLIDKRDGMGGYVYASENRDNYWRNWRNSDERVSVCLGCYNRRRPLIKAAKLWNENRLLQKRIERAIYEQRKNSRSASGIPLVSNGGSEGRQANN